MKPRPDPSTGARAGLSRGAAAVVSQGRQPLGPSRKGIEPRRGGRNQMRFCRPVRGSIPLRDGPRGWRPWLTTAAAPRLRPARAPVDGSGLGFIPPRTLTAKIAPRGRGVLSRKTRSATFPARHHFARPTASRVFGYSGLGSVIKRRLDDKTRIPEIDVSRRRAGPLGLAPGAVPVPFHPTRWVGVHAGRLTPRG